MREKEREKSVCHRARPGLGWNGGWKGNWGNWQWDMSTGEELAVV